MGAGAPSRCAGDVAPPDDDALAALDDDALRLAVNEACREISALQARLFVYLREIERREAYQEDGAGSMAEWLGTAGAMTRSSAVTLARAASNLRRLPALESALRDGALSLDQVSPLAEVATRENDAWLASEARDWSPGRCRSFARRERSAKQEAEQEAHEKRFFRISERAGGTWRLSGLLSADAGAIVATACQREAERMEPDSITSTWEPYEARMADALCALVGAGAQAEEPGRPSLFIHVDAGVLGREAGAAGNGIVEAEGGRLGLFPLCGETARRLACDSTWQLLAEGTDGQPLGLGRTQRTVPSWLRATLVQRDGFCRFPGCTNTRLLHAHHIQHWAKGGRTDPDNLVLLCLRHHRFVHEAKWELRGNPNKALEFIRPNGTILRSNVPPRRNRAPSERPGAAPEPEPRGSPKRPHGEARELRRLPNRDGP